MPTQRIYLIGMPGCGKSSLGKKLARYYQLPFIDLDKMIEERIGMGISVMFNHLGEEAFRLAEREAMRASFEFPVSIIACGGGTPCYFTNMEELKQQGICMYVNAPVGVLSDRLKQSKSSRPLLKGVQEAEMTDFLKEILAKRQPFYEQAQLRIEVISKSSETLYRQAIEAIDQYEKAR